MDFDAMTRFASKSLTHSTLLNTWLHEELGGLLSMKAVHVGLHPQLIPNQDHHCLFLVATLEAIVQSMGEGTFERRFGKVVTLPMLSQPVLAHGTLLASE
eukprot:gnl/MRDRNA2_/MRDRNA2_77974_c0_seq2.p1 gnl/MRDRNA2_/MRDRNA2_77974_c0~~gnl/MRDRNA2_/MRDRNA2_77974_c0_seq2.p1  ORF type:complete len:100 (+),score=13.15 gnl/MRDRNA2_/MRDRNA2_77974_c0_seq2:17-316(+)